MRPPYLDGCAQSSNGRPTLRPDVEGIEALIAARREYAPWMAEQLGYSKPEGLDVLDLGCGQGIDVCEFGLAGARVTGIDLTPRHIELARIHFAK